ncbi:MAG: aminopeptidase P family protein [Pseudomonadota bacterium]
MSNAGEDKLQALRAALKDGGFTGFVVPTSDEHMSEYIGDYAQRLAWLTGFTGSMGTCALTLDKAALFVDGRYTTQAREQIKTAQIEHCRVPDIAVEAWLKDAAGEGDVIGFDPWLHSAIWQRRCAAALKSVGAALKPITPNPIDTLWKAQPGRPARPIADHDEQYAGEGRARKLTKIARETAANGADACVIASLDGAAWAMNMRGSDIAHCPVAFAYLIVPAAGRPTLCVQEDALSESLSRTLEEHVTIAAYADFAAELAQAAQDAQVVQLDPQTCVAALFDIVAEAGAGVLEKREPTTLAKACKNATERDGTRAAHRRDGAALTRFLKWFDDAAPSGNITELKAADQLALERAKTDALQDLSFRTISAAGPHAALPHYSVTQDSDLAVPSDGLYLVDSGGQYLDGTTDVTRTIQVGDISEEAKARYTDVLKGHIAIATARFPQGTPGGALDTLARQFLWQAGTDYDHGTGHGVGSYLNVHEGPQRIAKANSDEPLREGMIVSNEPGYYREGAFGIRIENLVLVTANTLKSDERPMLEFETLTLAPIDTRPIVRKALTEAEIGWLNRYHARVRAALEEQLEGEDLDWMRSATAPI